MYKYIYTRVFTIDQLNNTQVGIRMYPSLILNLKIKINIVNGGEKTFLFLILVKEIEFTREIIPLPSSFVKVSKVSTKLFNKILNNLHKSLCCLHFFQP